MYSHYFQRMAHLLSVATGADHFDRAWGRNNGRHFLYFRPPWSTCTSFGDASYSTTPALYRQIMGLYARAYADPVYRWYAEQVDGGDTPGGDPLAELSARVSWPDPPAATPPHELPRSIHMADTGWVALRVVPSGLHGHHAGGRAVGAENPAPRSVRPPPAHRGREARALLHRHAVAADLTQVPQPPVGAVGTPRHLRLLLRGDLRRLLRHQRSGHAPPRVPVPAAFDPGQGALVPAVRPGGQVPAGDLSGAHQAQPADLRAGHLSRSGERTTAAACTRAWCTAPRCRCRSGSWQSS